MAISKVIYGDKTLLDLTGDTVVADKLLKGYTAHDKAGEPIVGSCTYDSDTQDATVNEAEILSGKTGYARGAKLTGSMPNNGAVSGVIESATGVYAIPQGYHDGSGKVCIDADEQAKLIPGNIKQGVTILGVVGTHEGASVVKAQSKEIVPSSSAQTVLPDSGYDYLSQVKVLAIPYVESDNAAGGVTVTIG